jgi:hypothetical protein
LTSPVLAKPLQFNNLSLDDNEYGDDLSTQKIGDSDTRLMEMLAAQAAHRDGSAHEDEDAVASNDKLTEEEKKDILQKALNMAASNGDVERIERILKGKAKDFVDVDAPDEEGTTPLIYASCFVGCQKSGLPMSTNSGARVTKLLWQLSSKLVRKSTTRTATSGAL